MYSIHHWSMRKTFVTLLKFVLTFILQKMDFCKIRACVIDRKEIKS